MSNKITVASTASHNMLVEVLEHRKLASASKASPIESGALGKTTKFVWYAAGKVEQALIEHYVGTHRIHHAFHNSLESYGCVLARWFGEGAEKQ